MEDKEITWQAPDFIKQEKSTDWYWIVGVITVTLSVTGFVFGNVLFGILVIIASVALTLQSSREPEIREFTVNQRGVKIDNILYPYSTLKSFWVENNPHEQKILLQSERALMPYIVIPIENIDPENIRDYMIKFVPEEEHQEPLMQKVMEYLGF
jgi:hypothetical protein